METRKRDNRLDNILTAATIRFRVKARPASRVDDGALATMIPVPVLGRQHCDMHAFRTHRKHGGLANSDIFPAVLARIKRETFGGRDYFWADRIPEGVTVDLSGFLAAVTITVP